MNIDSLVIRNDCYYIKLKTKYRELTNFVFRNAIEHINGSNRRESVTVDIYQGGSNVATVQIPEEAWSSRAKFLHSIKGITNLAYFGSGSKELELIKYYVITNEKNDSSGS
jgi:hypothetical protein